MLAAITGAVLANAQWSDNFDSYQNGQQLHNVNGWEGWEGNAGAGALVTNAQSASNPNSVDIRGASDLVQKFTGANSGLWEFTGKVYVPTAMRGDSYFIMMNTYPGTINAHWSVQMKFQGALGTVTDDNGTATPVAFLRDTWMDFKVAIDLTNDFRTVSLMNQTVSTGTWTQNGGALNVGAIDLFANGQTSVYYDDLALKVVPEPATMTALGLGVVALIRRRRSR
ncbi:MAG: PEP-CTERM sorting domain-containing protein [Fimbriimonadaceae bacterium]|nr:MAG: PEP-CTERM sorting domain-containing protein [Fimbriimonadaceae bacterium]